MGKERPERDSSVDVEEAKAILQKSVSKGISECREEIDKILVKYNCTLRPRVTLVGKDIIFGIDIVPGLQKV